MKARQTYYHVLNVSPRASDEAVRRAYRALALRWHPDRNPHNRQQAQRRFMLVNRAYSMLRTRPQRAAYNRYLLASTRQRQRSSRARIFFANLKEIFWPFAGAQRHG